VYTQIDYQGGEHSVEKQKTKNKKKQKKKLKIQLEDEKMTESISFRRNASQSFSERERKISEIIFSKSAPA
jgi:hypothetical protein